MRWMPGEVSTRAGGPMARLTSLPRRQAGHHSPSVQWRGWGPGRASRQPELVATAAFGGERAASEREQGARGHDGNGCGRAPAGHA